MTTTLITACTGIPSETDAVVISPNAVPFLLAAGYIHRDQHLRDQLASTPTPVVLDLEEA